MLSAIVRLVEEHTNLFHFEFFFFFFPQVRIKRSRTVRLSFLLNASSFPVDT